MDILKMRLHVRVSDNEAGEFHGWPDSCLQVRTGQESEYLLGWENAGLGFARDSGWHQIVCFRDSPKRQDDTDDYWRRAYVGNR